MKYLVWFSWWTDSVFVAWYLKQAWHEVLLVNLKNTKEKNKCCSLATELLKVSTFLGLPLKIVDATKDFKKLVIENFIQTYLKGHTPNPCINCNENVRFQILEKLRQELAYDKVATWHYVNVSTPGSDFYTFYIPKDKKKDQTYMLYRLVKYQNIVKHLDFPISRFEKSEVKKIVEENNIPINTWQESQNICFIPDDDYPRFIKQAKAIRINGWKIIDINGNYLWEHKWLIYYTIWQRKGLNINTNEKKYVVDLDWNNNVLVVWDDKDLFKDEVNIRENEILALKKINYEEDVLQQLKKIIWIEKVYWKIRYKWNLTEIDQIYSNKVKFKTSVRAVTKWQHLVLYWEKDWKIFVIWGGEIVW